MTWTLTPHTSHADTSALSTYTTPSSYTPTANVPVFAWVVNTKASPVSTPTSVTGNGLTWTLIAGVENAATTIRGGLYWAIGASPSNGALSVAFSGNQTGCAIHVFELSGAATTGTIVQHTTNVAAGASSVTLTLSAFASGTNATIACFGGLRQVGINPDSTSGWTEIYDTGYATPATEAESAWLNSADTSIVGAWSAGTADIFGVAIEVQEATTTISGTLTATLAGASLSATGQVDVQGALSQTLANVTMSATGQVDVQGSAGVSLGGVSLTGAGQVLVDGTLGQTLGPVVLAGTGLVLVNGALVQTLASAGLSATGTVGNSTINGNLSQALASVSLVGVGQVAVQGALAQTLAVVTLLAWGGSGVLLSVDVADAAVYLVEAGDRAVFAVVLGDALVYDVSLSDGD